VGLGPPVGSPNFPTLPPGSEPALQRSAWSTQICQNRRLQQSARVFCRWVKVEDLYQEIGNVHCQVGASQDNVTIYAAIHGYPVSSGVPGQIPTETHVKWL
jgi:hypothetical protein